MNHSALLLAIILLSISSLRAVADEPPKPHVDGDIQDIVYLGSKHPIFLRLHLRINGQGFRTLQRQRSARLFAELDQDGNGHLDTKEAEDIPPPNQISPNSRNANFIAGSIDISPADQKISAEEFARYVAIVSGHPFVIQFALNSGQQTTGLFTKLDVDGNLSLSADEFRKAHTTLRKFDLDDDGAFGRTELQPFPDIALINAPGGMSADDGPRHFYAILPYVLPKSVAETIITTYGSWGRDQTLPKLSHEQLGVSPRTIAKYDTDADELLNRQELVQFLRAPTPHVELRVQLPYRKFGFPRISAESETFPAKADKRRRSVTLDFNSVGIEMRVKSTAAMTFDNQQFYKIQFLRQDADKNKYLDDQEFNGLGIAGATFAMLDKNDDGMIFIEEVIQFVNRQADASQSRTIMKVTTTGKPLFDLLDANRDARLSERELAQAFRRLTKKDADNPPCDADADGRITATEIDGQYRVTFEMGKPSLFANMQPIQRGMQAGGPSEAGLSGPLWFRKMDKNRDRDVSRKEFLGSNQDFEKLDANDDGLIDEQEAQRASK